MFETALMLVFCLLMALVSLLVVVWIAITGRIVYLDGLTLSLICLTLGAFFMFPLFLSYRKGELPALLNHYLKRSAQASPSSHEAATKPPKADDTGTPSK